MAARVHELEIALLSCMEAMEEMQSRIDQQSSILTSMHRAVVILGQAGPEQA